MSSAQKLEIAVLGSGPAGLSAAIFLRRQGCRVTIYERFEEAQPVGAGLMLQPTGMSALHQLGLLDQIYASSQQVDQIIGKDADSGRTVLDVHYSFLGGNRFGLGTHRHVLFQALYDEAVQQGVEFEFGQTIVDVVQSASGASPLTANGTKLSRFDLVINACGSDSQVANNLFDIKSNDLLPFGALWGVVDLCTDQFSPSVLSQRYRGARVMIGVLPLGPGGIQNGEVKQPPKTAIFWSLPARQYEATLDRGLEAWQEKVCGYWPEMRVLVEQIREFDALSLARYRHYTLANPYKGRVVCIGDAYHSTSPQLGQGANMALLDALALDHAVKMNKEQPEGVGPAFHRLRKWHINIFQGISILLTPMYQSESAMVSHFRDRIIAPASRVPPIPKMMAALLSGLFWKPFGKMSAGQNQPLILEEPDWLQLAAET